MSRSKILASHNINKADSVNSEKSLDDGLGRVVVCPLIDPHAGVLDICHRISEVARSVWLRKNGHRSMLLERISRYQRFHRSLRGDSLLEVRPRRQAYQPHRVWGEKSSGRPGDTALLTRTYSSPYGLQRVIMDEILVETCL